MEDKKAVLANLYTLRAGLSQIAIEKDKSDNEFKAIENIHKANEKLNEEIKVAEDELVKGQLKLKEVQNNVLRECDKEVQDQIDSLEKRKKYYLDHRAICIKLIIISLIIGAVIVGLAFADFGIGNFFYEDAITNGHGSDIDNAQEATGLYMRDKIFPVMLYISYGFFGLGALFLVIMLLYNLFVLVVNTGINRYNKPISNKIDRIKNNRVKLREELYNRRTFRWSKELKDNEQYRLNIEKAKNKQKEESIILAANTALHNENIYVYSMKSKALYDALSAKYADFLDERDWSNLDLIIYYLEAKRADTLKEALQILEQRMQFEDIKKMIVGATMQISENIEKHTVALGKYLNTCFNSLAEQVSTQSQVILKSISTYQEATNLKLSQLSSQMSSLEGSIEKIKEKQERQTALVASQASMQAALLQKINSSSQELADNSRYMRNLAENYEVRRRNSF